MKIDPHCTAGWIVAGLLALLLAAPTEIRVTVDEIMAHDVDAVVSIDARHADQEAHLEHSSVELHHLCAACFPSAHTGAISQWSAAARNPVEGGDRHLDAVASPFDPGFDLSTRGRAPPCS